MSVEIKVPRLGWNMEQGVFLGWLRPDGAAIKPGEALYTLEGDKAVQEVEATDAGTLCVAPNGPRAGDTVEVGTLLGHLLAAGETAPIPAAAEPLPARRADRPAISPRARRVARELGIDAANLHGSGRAGRIRERDVRAAAAHSQADERIVPISPARRTIARRLVEALRTAAPVTLTTTADATNLVNLREQFRAVRAPTEDVAPTFTDLIVKLTAVALSQHPQLNARWEEDRIVEVQAVHVGIAVDVEEGGLVVPVLRDVSALGLRQIAARSRMLVDKARSRRLSAAEQEGGTFTVTNLGAFGIDAFTPILNPPQVAILGVGRIRRRPAVLEERVVPRDELTLSLTFDHRAIDGAPAARFLDTLRRIVENPTPSLVT